MKLSLGWGGQVRLKDGSAENLIYTLDVASLPKAPGVYVLGRRWGSGFEALYVGKARNLQGRLKRQLNNLRLMQHLGHDLVNIQGTLLRRYEISSEGKHPKKFIPRLMYLERSKGE